MGTFIATMTTHKTTDVTEQFKNLNLCNTHKEKPKIFEVVAGRKRSVYFIAVCKCDECGVIDTTGQGVVDTWNYLNTE